MILKFLLLMDESFGHFFLRIHKPIIQKSGFSSSCQNMNKQLKSDEKDFWIFPQTCDIDLNLQAAFLVHRHCRPLGDHAALDRLRHDGRGAAGRGTGGVATSATAPSPTTFLPTPLIWPLQELLDQLEPVEDEKYPEVVEDHREAGGLMRGSKRR